MATVIVNGKTLKCDGQSVSIVGNKVIIDGIVQADGDEPAEVLIHGNVSNLSCDRNIEISGNVESVSGRGSINCRTVNGNIDGTGSINVNGDVHGDIRSGGSVNVCGNVQGSVKAGGALIMGR